MIHSVKKRNAFVELRSPMRVLLVRSIWDRLSAIQAGSVIEVGRVLLFAPYTWTVMPGVEVTSSSADSFRGVSRSITSPSAIAGATAGLTCAVQPVAGSPSTAREGSPKVLGG